MGRFLPVARSLAYGVRRSLGNLVLVMLAGPALAEPVTIAALGDSLTQGYGLPAEEGFVPQLQAWLDAEGVEAVVVNAGVSGDTTAGGLARIGWTLTPEVDALIVNLGGNDLLRGLDPDMSRSNLDGILAAAEAAEVAVLLVGMEAPGNYGPEFKAAFDGMFAELAEERGAMLYPQFFAALTGEGIAAGRTAYMQPDGVHPNAEGVARIVADMGPVVRDLAARAAGVAD